MGRKLIIAGVGLVVIAAVAVGGAMYGLFGPRFALRGRAAQSHQPPKLGFVDVKELTLRLADTDAEHYIRMTPVLAVAASDQETVEDRIPIVRDRIVSIVSSRTSTVLATPQGEARLKKDLIDALHKEFGDDVVDVYFSGYLVE
jgi:flagellar protein FliL